ncbi:MAG TPA: RNA-directed DNA polymerase [Solirubrobacterales bacterium]|nr:RNA-directed DNA polymerase [Solirubrobacterales bacterium]
MPPDLLTVESLLRRGYFPRELPPPFTTGGFADLADGDRSALPGGGRTTQCVRYNLARLDGGRRPIQIPNPWSFLRLAEECEACWPSLKKRFDGHTFSMSRPVAEPGLERAVQPHYRLGEWNRLRPADWRGRRFILRTDISQFYASLYTHAIPWALEGKVAAKSNRGRTPSDSLDRALRNATDGQTMGVPIGPDTSFLAAEIVLTAVDEALEAKMPLRGHRYIDDYELAFRARSEAEEAQALIEDVLATYELAINPNKTEILELPQPFHVAWTHELQTFQIRAESSKRMINDLLALFSRAAEMSSSRSGPLKYALLRSRDVQVDDEDGWSALQNLVWSAVSAEPTTMPTALDLLVEKSTECEIEVDRDAAAEAIEALIKAHSPIRNASEVAWGVWAAIKLGVPLSAEAGDSVSAMEDDCVALLALDAESRAIFGGEEVDKARWEGLTDYDGVLEGPHWLLAYEGSSRGWLEGARRRVEADPFFKVLGDRGVSFYDQDPHPDPFTGPAGPLPGGLVPDDYV